MNEPLNSDQKIHIDELPFLRRGLIAFGDQVFLDLPESYQQAHDVRFQYRRTGERTFQGKIVGYVNNNPFVIRLSAVMRAVETEGSPPSDSRR